MKITRFELITAKGREIVRENSRFNYDIQDNGKTLKVFEISPEDEKIIKRVKRIRKKDTFIDWDEAKKMLK